MWTTELDQALKNVKKCLIITLVSVFCDVIKATRTCTDASRQGQGMGFVTQQQTVKG